MSFTEKLHLAFNRGIISPIGLARIDIKRLAMAAAIQTNWIPRVLGSMMLRPGLGYLGSTDGENAARFFPFVFSSDDTALVEFTHNKMRVWIDDALVTIPSVAQSVVGPACDDIADWDITAREAGTLASSTGLALKLTGTGVNSSIIRQQVAVGGGDQGTEHTITVIISRGPIKFRVGSSAGGDQFVGEKTLGIGEHHFQFTPSTVYHIQFSSSRAYATYVEDCRINQDATLEVTTPWATAELDNIRVTQSGDVIFIAAADEQQWMVKRYDDDSWAVERYFPENGPFRDENVESITISSDAISGDVTLTASKAIFKSTNLNSLYRISSVGQLIEENLDATGIFSDHIRVVGADSSERTFSWELSGGWSGTVSLQRSVGAPGSWVDVFSKTANEGPLNYYDGLNNQEIYYRWIFTAKTTGPVTVNLTFASGSIDGIVRVTAYTSETEVDGIVLTNLGGITGSETWWEGAWSERRGWPTAVALYEARMWWVGADNIWGSVTDGYLDYDDTVEGDSGPISRRVGKGPIESIHWLLAAGRLLMGTAENSANIPPATISGTNPSSIRSSSFGEPLTPTNFNIKDDTARGVFVDRTGQRLFELTAAAKQYSSGLGDYSAEELTLFTPDLNSAGIERIAVQLKPDVRVHCLRADGTAGVLVFDRAENVICWIEVETDGEIEDCVTLPGTEEDQVYYVVKRVINSVTKRYLEKWALETEGQGGTINKMADSFLIYSGGSVTTITGLTHLEGETVSVWGNSKDLGTYTVASGQITGITEAVTYAIVGLVYTAQFQSAKLATLENAGLNEHRALRRLGLVLYKTHYQALQYGPDFSNLYDLPKVERGQITSADTLWETYDEDLFNFGGEWNVDSRLCLEATAPRPCTILSAKALVEES